jgi:ABC-type phosphate transport system auxiliary subunit
MAPLALELVEHSTRQSSRIATRDRCLQHFAWMFNSWTQIFEKLREGIWALERCDLCMIM